MVTKRTCRSRICRWWRQQHALHNSRLAASAAAASARRFRCRRHQPTAARSQPAHCDRFRFQSRPGLLPQRGIRIWRLHAGAQRRQRRIRLLFAGIAALIAQKYGAQGNLAPHLYALSGKRGIFADVAQGSAQLPCVAGSAGCDASGEIGYTAQSGYDLATGLGVPDAHALVTDFASPQLGSEPTTVVLTLSPSEPNSTYNPAALITFTATVTSTIGVPDGTVTFHDQNTGQDIGSASLNGNGVAAISVEGIFNIGGNTIVAEYSGDQFVYNSQNSAPKTFTTQPSSTSLTLVPSTTSVTPGQNISVVVTLTVGTPPAPGITPPDVVTLTLDGSNVGSEPLSASGSNFAATFPTVTIPSNGNSSHSLQASYPVGTDFAGSNSGTVNLTVNKITTTLTISPATLTPGANSSLMVTATINPALYASTDPTGTVQFTLDGANVGGGNVSSGNPSTATFTIQNVTAGTHTLGASYNGDNIYGASNASTVTINASKIATTLTISPATFSPVPNASLVVTATLNPANYGSNNPSGTVQFTLDGANVGTGNVSGSNPTTATFTIQNVAAGTHTLGGSYNGDSTYAGSIASTVTINASKIATSLSISPATFTPLPNASLVITATLNPANSGSSNPSGTVQFTLDGANVGTGNVSGSNPTTATFTIQNVPAGTHTLGASYNGDSSYAGSTASTVTINASKITTSLTISPASLTPPGNSPLVVTATINPANYGSTNPTGTIQFTLDGANAGSSPVTSGQPSTATFTIPNITSGSHTLGGSYNGDSTYAASTAQTVTINAAKAATVTTLTSTPTPLVSVVPVSFTATVAPANAVAGTTYTLTGTVSFYDGASLLGTATVNGDSATLSGITLAATASHTIRAVYSGDTSWLTSTSNLLTLAQTSQADTVVLTANYSVAPPGVAIILTATVTPATPPLPTAEQKSYGYGPLSPRQHRHRLGYADSGGIQRFLDGDADYADAARRGR